MLDSDQPQVMRWSGGGCVRLTGPRCDTSPLLEILKYVTTYTLKMFLVSNLTPSGEIKNRFLPSVDVLLLLLSNICCVVDMKPSHNPSSLYLATGHSVKSPDPHCLTLRV